MSTKTVHGIGCPACGGSLEIVEGSVVIDCRFCGAGLRVKGDRGIPRYYVPLSRSREQILDQVRRWWKGFSKAPDLAEQSRITEAFPIFVPFWRVTALVIGWVLGDVEKGSGKNKRYVPVERRVFSRQERTSPACDIGEFGVEEVDLSGDEILPFDLETVQQSAMTFGVMTTPTDVVAECNRQFLSDAGDAAGVDRQKFSRLHMLNFHLSLVYYPLWVIRYEYRNRVYQITADGESGRLLYGRAPGNILYRVACLLGAILPANFIITTMVRNDPDDGIIGALIVAFAIMYIGFRKFRYGGEVTIGKKLRRHDIVDRIQEEFKKEVIKKLKR